MFQLKANGLAQETHQMLFEGRENLCAQLSLKQFRKVGCDIKEDEPKEEESNEVGNQN